MKRIIILLLVVFCFMFVSCNKLVNSAMSLKDENEQNELLTGGKQQLESLESENNSDEPISKSIEIQEEQPQQEEQLTETPKPEPVKNNNQIADKGDFDVSVDSFDVSRKALNNNNVFFEAIGFDADKNLVIRYATAIAYSNISDADENNDSMRVTIEAFDADDDLLWKEQQEFSDYKSTELGDFSVLMIDKKGNLIIENLSYNSSSTLRCLSYKNGNVNWAVDAFSVSIVQDNEGNYYYATYYGKELICLDSKGSQKWAVDFSDGDTYFWPSISLKNDSIIVNCTEVTNNGEKSAKLEYDKAGKLVQKIE